MLLCVVVATITTASPIAPHNHYPYYAAAPLKYAPAPYVHAARIVAPAPYYHHAPAPYIHAAAAAPYVHHAAPYVHHAPIVKAAIAAPLAQSYTSFSQVVTHPQPIVKVAHAEPLDYPVHYDPAPVKYTAAVAAPLFKSYAAAPYTAAYAHHYWNVIELAAGWTFESCEIEEDGMQVYLAFLGRVILLLCVNKVKMCN